MSGIPRNRKKTFQGNVENSPTNILNIFKHFGKPGKTCQTFLGFLGKTDCAIEPQFLLHNRGFLLHNPGFYCTIRFFPKNPKMFEMFFPGFPKCLKMFKMCFGEFSTFPWDVFLYFLEFLTSFRGQLCNVSGHSIAQLTGWLGPDGPMMAPT